MRPRSAKKGSARYARGEEAEVSDVGAFPRLARDALRVPSLGAPWHLGDLARGLLLPRIDEATERRRGRQAQRLRSAATAFVSWRTADSCARAVSSMRSAEAWSWRAPSVCERWPVLRFVTIPEMFSM